MEMRYDYIDILKGFTIIWVLWMHMDLPEIIYPSVQMPIFFFISGMFYHAKGSFLEQIKGDSFRLLVPTVCFMAIAAILIVVWGGGFQSWNIIDVLQSCRNASLAWFLIALFCYRAFNYPIEKYEQKMGGVALAVLVYLIGYLWKVYCPKFVIPIIPLQEIFMFGIYYVLGYILGKKVIGLSWNWGWLQVSICLVCIGYIIFVHFVDWNSGLPGRIPFGIYSFPYTLACIYMGLTISRLLECYELVTKPLTYVGRNSIVFYLTHWPLWIYVFRPLDWDTYSVFFIIVLMEFPLIYIITNYLPWIIGRERKYK